MNKTTAYIEVSQSKASTRC